MSILSGVLSSSILSGVFGRVFRGAGFSPSDIADLALWLDASDETTITESGGSVSQWSDKSGNGNHATQGTGANQPTTGGTLNGKNALTFVGTDPNFFSLTSDISRSNGYTVFFVGENTNTANGTIIGGGVDSLSIRFDPDELDIVKTGTCRDRDWETV